ncbi:MAG: ABC transporter permease, partial [Actinobacteria bacterium]|nr:ABC transporter permease [Actinomycetota bacterium]
MSPFVRRAAYRTSMFVLAVALVGVLWELYKVLGPEDGGKVLGINIFPRSNDTAMPHIWDMLARYGRPEVRGSDRKIWVVVLSGAWFSFRLSVVGFALGASIGVGLAVLMTRYKVVERGLLPY